MTKNTSDYNASNIQVLEGIQHIRLRPAMYIGDTGPHGLHHLVKEILDNSIDEAMNGFCSQIDIVLERDLETISIEDNGRGIPVDKHPKLGKSALEVVMTIPNAGGKFDTSGYKASGGLHGVGATCVTSLSDSLTAEVWRDGGYYTQSYVRGIASNTVKKVKSLEKSDKQHGTKITFHADAEIFKQGIKFDENSIITRIRQVAYLNKGLRITFTNKATGFNLDLKSDSGISDYISYLTEARSEHYPAKPIYGEREIPLVTREGNVKVEVALQWAADENDDEMILSFANNIYNSEGGTHETGFKTSLTRVVNDFGRKLELIKDKGDGLQGRDVRESLTAIVSVKFSQAEFVGQTKDKLATSEIEGITSSAVIDILTDYFDKNAPVIKKIVERAILAAEARDAAKKQSNLIKRGGLFGKNNRMPTKLIDCNSDKMENSELFIVEGDSASGSGKKGRDPETQAILPIRGKIINAEKNDLKKLIANKEIVAIIKAIGTGILDDFDIDKLRYNKVIIMSDADTDGAHIATLLITFFYKYMKPLISHGHVYIAQPPLFRIGQDKKKAIYCYNEHEMQEELLKQGNKSKVTRFKGLGEMDFDELGFTTMDPAQRHLLKVILEDAGESERILSILMGNNISARKNHISSQINSIYAGSAN